MTDSTEAPALQWTPSAFGADMHLLDVQEGERDVSATVTAQWSVADGAGGGALPKMTWASTPELPPCFTVAVEPGRITFASAHVIGMFPIVSLQFLLPGSMEVHTVFEWEDLPAGAIDVVTFRPYPNSFIDYFLTITADGEAREYIIRAFKNFTPDRDRLRSEVNARRRS